MFDLSILPPGLFKTFLELWATFRYTYVGVLEFFTSFAVDLSLFGFGNFSLMSVLTGSGVFSLIGFRVVKMIIK